MGVPSDRTLTQLIERHRAGDLEAFDLLVEKAYAELRVLARQQMRRARGRQTLETRALINEAYLRLAEESGLELRDRGHFYAVMARAMRFVVVDHARQKGAAKRGGGVAPTTLEPELVGAEQPIETVLAVHRAIEQLESFAPRLARIVEGRFFAGFDDEEIARSLEVSTRTVQRDWLRARAWLQRSIEEGGVAG